MATARFLFIDLNEFLSSLGEQTEEQGPPQIHAAVDPGKLTLLLEGKCSVTACRGGSYMEPYVAEGEALRAAGWDMKKERDLGHPTLENMLTKAYEMSGPCGSYDRKVLVVATGVLTASMRSSLKLFLDGNWRVELRSFQRCWQPDLEQMKMAFAPRFQVVNMDERIPEFVVSQPSSIPIRRPILTTAPASIQSSPATSNADTKNWRRPGSAVISPSMWGKWFTQRSSAPLAEKDRLVAQRRAQLLAALPVNLMPTNQTRIVFMDVDDITVSLFSSQHFYSALPGATQTRDLRLGFEPLTDHVCGHNRSLVKCQLALFATTHPVLTRLLPKFGWNPLAEGKSCTLVDLKFAIKRFETLELKTLVIASGNCQKLKSDSEAFRKLVVDCLQNRWCVEIYSWLHSLDEGFIYLQRTYPTQFVVRPLDYVLPKIVHVVLPNGDPSPPANITRDASHEGIGTLLQRIHDLKTKVELLQQEKFDEHLADVI